LPDRAQPSSFRGVKKPHVLLIFLTRFEESTAMLKGIAHFEHTHHLWTAFHDDQGFSVTDPRWIRNKRWHGVISRHTTPELVSTCAKLKIPLVDLNDTDPFPGVPKIRPDNFGIGRLGAEHFIELGFQNFGFAGFSDMAWACERRDGFVETVRGAGHECALFDIVYPGDTTPSWVEHQISGLAVWLKKVPKPIGLMGCMDLRAQQLINAAHAADILVPEEVAVLGANNDPIRCELADPSLSSVALNSYQSGYRAASLLSDILAGRKVASFDQRVEPISVVTRHSTDVLAVADRNVVSALSFIREQACSGITVDQVLQHAHVSRSQMERKFRQHIGRSPQAEIRRVQLRKIRQLLLETDFPLKQIAELTGFEHMEYMCVLFKRLTGVSPGAYRARMQDKSLIMPANAT